MKRLHIIGKSKDNRRIFLARAKDAKFGSFEVPISAKLRKLVREAEDAKRPAARRGRPAAEAPAAEAPAAREPAVPEAFAPEAQPRETRSEPPKRPARATTPVASGDTKTEPDAGAAGDAPRKRTTAPAAPAPTTAADIDEVTSVRVVPRRQPAAPQSRPTAAPEGVDLPLAPRGRPRRDEAPAEALPAEVPQPKRARRRTAATAEKEGPKRGAGPTGKAERSAITARTKRPEIPARSKLSPAEIQSLIRAGRTVRTVAQMAGTQVAWVKWLAEPVQQERMAVVGQALRERQTRARLGASAEPLGASVALNLRSRGVSGAERVVEEGFTAVRSDGRRWRVRLSFEHRGRRTSAVWTYDPGRHELTPVNTLAAQLGWRRPRALASEDTGAAEADGGASPRPGRRSAGSTSRGSKAAAARRTTGKSRRSKPSSRVSSRRRST